MVVTVRFAPKWRRQRFPAESVPDLLRREHIFGELPGAQLPQGFGELGVGVVGRVLRGPPDIVA